MNTRYWNRYLKFIEWCDTRPEYEYRRTEKHHIMPRSFGGDNSKDNLIKLSTREHFIAHYLIYKAIPCFKTACVLKMFKAKNGRQYELFKEFIDNTKSEEERRYMSEYALKGDDNPSKRPEVRKKISESNKKRWQNEDYRNSRVGKNHPCYKPELANTFYNLKTGEIKHFHPMEEGIGNSLANKTRLIDHNWILYENFNWKLHINRGVSKRELFLWNNIETGESILVCASMIKTHFGCPKSDLIVNGKRFVSRGWVIEDYVPLVKIDI